MNLGMSVLSGLRGAHLNDFARAVFNADETVLAKRRALHGIGGGGASIGALESVLMLYRYGQQASTAIAWWVPWVVRNGYGNATLPARRRPYLETV